MAWTLTVEWILTKVMLESMVVLRTFEAAKRKRLQDYLSEALGAEVLVQPCSERSLPAYLLYSYAFACGQVLGTDYVFAAPTDKERTSGPFGHAKQVGKLAQEFGRAVVLVLDTVTARDRQRLVGYRTPFIVPFQHMYLPHSGVDFRERVVGAQLLVKFDVPGSVPPSTQLVLLFALLTLGPVELHIRRLAHDLGVSEMTVSRALRDLEALGLVERWKEGRRRPARLAGAPRDVWEKSQQYLASPAEKHYAVFRAHIPGALDAGLTALSHLSDLIAPQMETVAVGPDAWRLAQRNLSYSQLEPSQRLFFEHDYTFVQVWTYEPSLLSDEGRVDPLSLYLSLKNDADERVQAALKQALADLPWM